jgi:outer membrane protein assembly factor BamB
MLGKTLAVLALTACLGVVANSPSLASSKSATESSPWFDTNSNAAASRANPTEKVLSPTAVTKAKYLRSVTAPPVPPKSQCGENVAAPVLVGGFLYLITNGSLSKYNAATGTLAWRKIPDRTFSFIYYSLAVSGSLVIVGGSDCLSASEPGGKLWAYNTSTGALVWSTFGPIGREIDDAVIATSYVITEGADAIGSVAQVFNLSNGSFVWSTQQGCGNGGHAVVVGLVVMSNGCDAQFNASLEGNSLATGALLWSLPGNWTIQRGDLSGSAGKHLYATNPSGTVVDVNPLTGQVGYSLSGADAVLAVDASRVYASCGSNALELCAYNISTGALEWQDTQLSASLAAEADGVLYLQSGDVLNAATGQTITTPLGSYLLGASAIAVGDGRIAVLSSPRVLDLFGLPGY